MSNDPTNAFFLRLQFLPHPDGLRVHRFHTDLGGGWKFDTSAYTYRYWNKQNYQNSATQPREARSAWINSMAIAMPETLHS